MVQTDAEVRDVLAHTEQLKENAHYDALQGRDDLELWAVALQLRGGAVVIEFYYAETAEQAEELAKYRSGHDVQEVLASEECP